MRDVSLLVDESLSAETVRGTIRSAAPDTLVQVLEFDRYQGKGIPDGKVSLSLRLTFQSAERTLTDDEVQAAMQRIIDALTRELQAVQEIGTEGQITQMAHATKRRPRGSNPSIGLKRRSSC